MDDVLHRLLCCRGEWERIGEVVGAGDDTMAGGGSKWHNGQLWDYGECCVAAV